MAVTGANPLLLETSSVLATRRLPARTLHPYLIALDLYLIGWFVAVWDMWYIDNRRHSVITAMGLLVIVLAPKKSILTMRLSLSIVPIMLWMLLSQYWSWNVEYFNAVLMKTIVDAPVLMVIAAIVPWDQLAQRLLVWFYVLLGFTYLYSLAYADARLMITPGETTWSWHGSFPHKNTMLMFLLFGLALVLGFEQRAKIRKVAVGAIVVLVLLAHSTTGLASLAVVLAVVLWVRLLQAERTSRRAAFLLVTLVAVSVLLAVGLWSIPYLADFAGKDTTFSGRTDIWSATWWAIEREPLKGYGLGGAYSGVELEPTREMVRQIGFAASSAHNGVLDLVLQLGWVGAAAFLVFMTPLCARGWFLVKARDPLGLTVVVFVATLLFVSISEPVFLLSGFSVMALLHPPLLTRVPRSASRRRAMLAAVR